MPRSFLWLAANTDLGMASLESSTSCEVVPAQPVDATPPDINLLPKLRCSHAETMEVIFGPASRNVEPLEIRRVVTCDWSRLPNEYVFQTAEKR
jgi:hypothetical protein